MKIIVLVARILLGLIFAIFGLNGFHDFMHAPFPGGVAGAFLGAMFSSHYLWLVCGTQLVSGLLFLTNRYVTLALVLTGALLANIITFHLTMMPMGLGMALGVTILWIILAWNRRASLSPIFAK